MRRLCSARCPMGNHDDVMSMNLCHGFFFRPFPEDSFNNPRFFCDNVLYPVILALSSDSATISSPAPGALLWYICDIL